MRLRQQKGMVKTKEMNQDMDTRTPRDRVTGDFLRQLEAEEAARHGAEEPMHSFRAVREDESPRRSSPVFFRQTPENTRGARDSVQEARDGAADAPKHPHRRHLAMVYAPEQMFGDLYDTDEALMHGTIFRELDFPFYPTKCKENGGICR